MKSLTIKNIPGPLYSRIKKQAAEHRRSLNQEVITCLEQMTGSAPIDSITILANTEALRQRLKARFARLPKGTSLATELLAERREEATGKAGA